MGAVKDKKTNPEIFWSHVQKTETCWLWTGYRQKSGGRFGTGGYGFYSGRQAHRRAYELLVGPIPEGLQLDHLCKVPRCVNPDHLEPVTQQENMRRHYGERTHCKHGHALDAANAYEWKGKQFCRACNRAASRKRLARLKKEAGA